MALSFLLPHQIELRNSLASNVMKSPSTRPGTGTCRRLPSSGWPRNKTLTLHAIPATICFRYDLGRGSEADVGGADHAALLHRRLQVIRAQPGAGLCHVGNILQDHNVIRVLGVAEHSPIRDTCGEAALLVSTKGPDAIKCMV